ncbi:hypothetical protein ACHAPS_008304 [Verticillium nonalfalfae]
MATATSSQCPDQPPAHDPSSLLHTTDVVPPTAPDEQRPPSQADGQLPPNHTEDAAMALRKLLKGKEEEWSAVSRRTGRLTLLELPFDILRLIVNEITHTNDLTSLALTNSTLHNLAVPHIYSRFDIVWPDATQLAQSDSKSVDALTYGLSTLCLGSNFAVRAQKMFSPKRRGGSPPMARLHNDYARYIKKFSLGNGPDDWVAEYMITKESGKMLGTLVALAVAKMASLETFVWDMPTGVLSDIFMALASIQDRDPDEQSKLERVWVRWHDNADASASSSSTSPSSSIETQGVVPIGSTLTPIGILIPSTASHPRPRAPIPFAESRVEFPTFSVLPPLRSLSVLDIDELSYLDELAVAIGNSHENLEELRVGISAKAAHSDFVQTWDGPGLHQVDHNARWPGESTIGDRRLGGVLGVLVGKLYDIRRKSASRSRVKSALAPASLEAVSPAPDAATVFGDDAAPTDPHQEVAVQGDEPSPVSAVDEAADMNLASPSPVDHVPGTDSTADLGPRISTAPHREQLQRSNDDQTIRTRLDGKLKLKTLELERVPLSIQVCTKAIDWTVLTSLTILECAQHETLWKVLRKQFQPTPPVTSGHENGSSPKPSALTRVQYHLNVKKIHTDMASLPLINFIKDTLEQNSLEVFFLQDRRRSVPPAVTISQIFKGAIKRHRSSLRKVLLDSSEYKAPHGNLPESFRWLNWTATTEMLLYMTSGRMVSLRELSMSLQYRDWHTLLQRLIGLPQLRSLHIPKIADHAAGNYDPRELALQIVDIISLRPEIQLCYVGIGKKCFEILENKPLDSSTHGVATTDPTAEAGAPGSGHVVPGQHGSGGDEAADDDEEDASDDDEDASQVDTSEDENEDGPGGGGAGNANDAASVVDVDDSQSEASLGSSDSDADSFREADHVGARPRLRLREILFYDDKVAIFKARHGRL